jgi:uncharacterized protein (DUF433 family)
MHHYKVWLLSGASSSHNQPGIYQAVPFPLAATIIPDNHVWKTGRILFMRFERITIDPAVCTGKPCIRNLRFPVSRLLGLLAAGETKESIIKAYPYIQGEDINEALRYASYLAEEETVELLR